MRVAFEVVPTATVGAEVRGVDLAAVTETQIEAIRKTWYRHDVLIFRNQKMSDGDLLSFSRYFGALDSPPNQGAGRKSALGYPEIYVVSNVVDGTGEPIGALGDGEAAWHTDMSYAPQPPDASMQSRRVQRPVQLLGRRHSSATRSFAAMAPSSASNPTRSPWP